MRSLALTLLFLAACLTPATAGTCTFNTIQPLAFGNYNPSSPTPLKVSGGSIGFGCTSGYAVHMSLSMGQNSLSFGTRRMLQSGGTSYLSYNIYLDAGYTQVWGDGTGGTVQASQNVPGSGGNITFPYYGMIPASQNVPSGTYNDTVTITAQF
jgi:spore coat protein U-like protein